MKPNILFILIDSCRSDRLFGETKNAKTPVIDNLISNGTYFSQTFSSSDYTGPCVQSIFNSRLPFGCGTTKDYYEKIYSKSTSHLTLLQENNYNLYAILEESVCYWGMKEPFENDDVEFASRENLHNGLESKILKKFDSVQMKEPWFFYLHLMDLHKPCRVPDSSKHLKESDRYDYNLNAIDSCIGKILKKIDLQNTLIVISADHGDYVSPMDDGVKPNNPFKTSTKSLIKKFMPKSMTKKIHESKVESNLKKEMSKFETGHEKRAFKTRPMADKTLFDDVIHVPLIFSGYNLKSTKTVEQLVRSIDIFPTIFDIVGVLYDAKKFHGRSIYPLFESEPVDEKPVYIESCTIKTATKQPRAVVGIRTSDFKYFRSIKDSKSNVHLYDLKNDSLEDNNIAIKNPDKVNEMELLLQDIQKSAKDEPPVPELSKEEEED